MKTTDTKKTGTKTATAALADINAQIEALKQQRIGLMGKSFVRAICPIDMTTLGSVGKWTVTAQGVNTLAVVGAVGIIQAKIDLLVAINEPDDRCAWRYFHVQELSMD